MNKKKIVIVLCSLLVVVIGIVCFFIYKNVKESEAPDSWEGIFRGTVYINELERLGIGVVIEEDDARKIAVTMRHGKNDVSSTFVDNSTEVEMKKTSSISFSMKTASERYNIPSEMDSYIFINLKYINEDTVEIKYGYTEEEMEACEPIELHHSAV